MTRALRPSDLAWLLNVQSDGQWLEIEDRVLAARSPLKAALRALLRIGPPERAVVVDLCVAGIDRALVLARLRPARFEADLLWVAPGLDRTDGATLAWARVVAEACHWLGAAGTQRVYAAVDEDDRLALQVLRQIGFVVYTADEVLQLASIADAARSCIGGQLDLCCAPADTALDLTLGRMVEAGLPEAVRLHVPGAGADWDSYPAGPARRGSLAAVCLDSHGAVVGGWRAVPGKAGSWLRLTATTGSTSSAVLATALRALADDRRFRDKPLYAAARGYEPDLDLALRDAGFAAILGRFRLVRHATVRILAPAWKAHPGREPALGAKPTAARAQRRLTASGGPR